MKILKKFDSYILENSESETQVDNELEVQNTEIDQIDNTEDPIDNTEEDDEYIGAKMLKELADTLGVEVIDNAVSYEGKTINFYSETEKFHVDKKKFNSVEDVVDYLTKENGELLDSDIKSDVSSKRIDTNGNHYTAGEGAEGNIEGDMRNEKIITKYTNFK